MDNNKLAIFKGIKIRRHWDEKAENLKNKLAEEGSEVYGKIVQLKLKAEDGKLRTTDAADIEILFRIVQSVPSPKAEPHKEFGG